MNILAIFVVLIVFALTVVFSIRVQTFVISALTLAGIIAQGVWRGVTGGIGVTIATVITAAWIAAQWTVIILGVLWIINFVTFLGIGFAVNAPWCGLILGLIVPVWSMLYIFSKIPVARQMTRAPWVLSNIVIVIALPLFLIGLWSPVVKKEADRWSSNTKQGLANELSKKSLKSESEAGVVGVLIEDATIYDNQGKMVWRVVKGTKVKASDLNGKTASTKSEGMTEVMLRNKYGDFVGGNIVNIPSRKIAWS